MNLEATPSTPHPRGVATPWFGGPKDRTVPGQHRQGHGGSGGPRRVGGDRGVGGECHLDHRTLWGGMQGEREIVVKMHGEWVVQQPKASQA